MTPPQGASGAYRPGGFEVGRPLVTGVQLADGTVYQLEGQPPPALSNGWGNTGWL